MIQCLVKKSGSNYELRKEVISLHPTFASLDEKDIMYIFYVEDYIYSPFARRPKREREIFARRLLYKDEKKKISSAVLKAMEQYRELIYDPRYYMKDIYNSKVNDLLKKMETLSAEDFGIIQKTNKTVSELITMIDRIDKDLEEAEDEVKLKGNRKLSLIEQMQRNRELYKSL